jgi:hypothetical protein
MPMARDDQQLIVGLAHDTLPQSIKAMHGVL